QECVGRLELLAGPGTELFSDPRAHFQGFPSAHMTYQVRRKHNTFFPHPLFCTLSKETLPNKMGSSQQVQHQNYLANVTYITV
ncbi:unnamed protein product, partial [Linum tenue]